MFLKTFKNREKAPKIEKKRQILVCHRNYFYSPPFDAFFVIILYNREKASTI